MNFKAIWGLLKETFSEWSEDRASRLAAALAYYTAFSLAPLLIIAIAVAGLVVGREAVQGQIVDQMRALLGEDGSGLIQTMLQAASQPGASIIATVVGVVGLLFGALGVFGQLQDALNTIWEVEPRPGRGLLGMVKDRLLSFTFILGTGFLLLVSLLLSTALSAFNNFLGGLFPDLAILGQVIDFAVSFGVITLLFALIYKVLPDVKIQWSDVWIGAAVTALLFTIGKFLIGLYLGHSSTASTFGAAGSLAVLLIWVYYAAQILFLGAEFTQVYARRFGSRIVPEEDAVQVTEAERAKQGMPHRETTEQAARQ